MQGDESLEHLSNVEAITASRTLYAGGEYVVNGTVTLTLPSDGTLFSITVQSGIVTFDGGTVETVTSATEQGPGRKVFAKVGGDWKVLSTSSANTDFRTVTTSTSLTISDSWIWADSSSGALILSIPVDMPSGKTYFVVRKGSNAVSVDPAGTEGVIDPATEISNTDGVTINTDGGIIALKKTGGHWSVTNLYQPQS